MCSTHREAFRGPSRCARHRCEPCFDLAPPPPTVRNSPNSNRANVIALVVNVWTVTVSMPRHLPFLETCCERLRSRRRAASQDRPAPERCLKQKHAAETLGDVSLGTRRRARSTLITKSRLQSKCYGNGCSLALLHDPCRNM